MTAKRPQPLPDNPPPRGIGIDRPTSPPPPIPKAWPDANCRCWVGGVDKGAGESYTATAAFRELHTLQDVADALNDGLKPACYTRIPFQCIGNVESLSGTSAKDATILLRLGTTVFGCRFDNPNVMFAVAIPSASLQDRLREVDPQQQIETLRAALQKVLDEEMPDAKSAGEFGGYRLDDEVREAIKAALNETDPR